MSKPAATDSRRLDTNQDLRALVDAIVLGNTASAREILKVSPGLVKKSAVTGASRAAASNYFYTEIRHYFYAGDTALHMAGAGFRFEIAQMLIDLGANCSAKNRRGAEPLHYASDCNIWNPTDQASTIQCLIRAGANPNATDMDGVAPIHRAVRTRCGAAVHALLSLGANPDLPNKSGSSPLHLAVQNTGRSGSGSPEAVEQQKEIILLLMEYGAVTRARDGRGTTVDEAISAEWIRELLHAGHR
jgi:hypothetical protein